MRAHSLSSLQCNLILNSIQITRCHCQQITSNEIKNYLYLPNLQYNWLHMIVCFINFIIWGKAAGTDHVILMQSTTSYCFLLLLHNPYSTVIEINTVCLQYKKWQAFQNLITGNMYGPDGWQCVALTAISRLCSSINLADSQYKKLWHPKWRPEWFICENVKINLNVMHFIK